MLPKSFIHATPLLAVGWGREAEFMGVFIGGNKLA